MERMRRIRERTARRRSARELTSSGIDVFIGEACFSSRDAIAVGGEILRFKRALIAAGARPLIPQIPGLEEAGFCLYGCFSKPQAVVWESASSVVSENLARVSVEVCYRGGLPRVFGCLPLARWFRVSALREPAGI
jgi:hypothetical protein